MEAALRPPSIGIGIGASPPRTPAAVLRHRVADPGRQPVRAGPGLERAPDSGIVGHRIPQPTDAGWSPTRATRPGSAEATHAAKNAIAGTTAGVVG